MLAEWNEMEIYPKNIQEFYLRAGGNWDCLEQRGTAAPVYTDLEHAKRQQTFGALSNSITSPY